VKLLERLAFLANTIASFVYYELKTQQDTPKIKNFKFSANVRAPVMECPLYN
jgi:hypothetical protein